MSKMIGRPKKGKNNNTGSKKVKRVGNYARGENSKYKKLEKIQIGDDLIELKSLPPQLRKLAKHMLKKGVTTSLANVCEELKMNYSSVTSQVYTLKKKGIDFNGFLKEITQNYLETRLIDVDNALVRGAIDGSHNHQKLYYQRTNMINNDQNINVNILSVGIDTSSSRPADVSSGKGVIDINPVIPNDDNDVFDED